MMRDLVVYDGDCGVCEWAAGWVKRYAPKVDVSSHTKYGVEHLSAVWYITSTGRHEGATAISMILKRSDPKTAKIAGAIIGAPGIRILSRGVYFLIAKNRRRLSKLLGLKTCQIPER